MQPVLGGRTRFRSRLFYGPLNHVVALAPEVFNGQVFALMEAGTYLPLAEFTITDDGPNQLSITVRMKHRPCPTPLHGP